MERLNNSGLEVSLIEGLYDSGSKQRDVSLFRVSMLYEDVYTVVDAEVANGSECVELSLSVL